MIVLLIIILSAAGPADCQPTAPAPAETAQDVARWLRTVAVHTPEGRAWPGDALAPSAIDTELGSGSAGVVLFWTAMHGRHPDGGYRDEVQRGADYLAAHVRISLAPAAPNEWTTGLYGPVAGVAYALHESYRVTGDPKHRAAALQLVELLHAQVQRDHAGAAWNQAHDILSGGAGTGLFLLYAADAMGHRASRDLAAAVGRKLIARAVPDRRGGLAWKPSYEARFVLPNFSHGPAGIGYFLARLHQTTGEQTLLDAAIGTATYLKNVADTADGGFRLFYGWPDPGWSRPYDIGWAHGPAGTARLFYQLWLVTRDPAWADLVARCAASLRASGLPKGLKPDYGSGLEMNQRFGAAGVAAFFLDLYRRSRDPADLAFARALVDGIIASGTSGPAGLKWTSKRPAFMADGGKDAEFTSYFYGAAGYGLLLLNLDAALTGRDWQVRLPDDPFGPVGRAGERP